MIGIKMQPIINQKVKTLDELSEIIQQLKKEGKRVVHCHGVFDLLHPGHIRYFHAAKREGDVLVVTLTPDRYVGKGPGRPVFNQQLRLESIAALECVDYVAINEWPTAVETIHKIKPDVYVKGKEYEKREDDITGGIYKEEDAIRSVGGRIYFTDDIVFSSTEILNAHFPVFPEEARDFLGKFRSKYPVDEVIQRLKDLGKLKVLVIGDTIIDEYHYCEGLGKSPKESIVTTRFKEEERFAGGVLATANHIANFCKEVKLVTCLGTENNQEEFILKHLKPNIQPEFYYRDDAPTIVKRRFVDPSFLTKMFQVCFLNDTPLPEHIEDEICKYLDEDLNEYDLVIASDFGHGLIGENIVNVLIEKARFLAVNTQTNSANTGYNLITKYPRADYVCIDEPEIRLATSSKFGDMKELMRQVSSRLKCDRVTVTRGHRGSITYAGNGEFHEVPVLSHDVVDRVGAGDAYLSITSPCVAMGYPMDIVGFIGNAVGALAVLVVCNRSSIEEVPLFKFITTLLK